MNQSVDNKILVNKRKSGDIWEGLYELILIEKEASVEDLMIDFQYSGSDIAGEKSAHRPANLFVVKASDEELKIHEAYLGKMKSEKKLIW